MSKWVIDPDHSVGAFSVRHMMIAHVHGQMNRVSGTVELDPSDLTSLSVKMEIGVASVLTGIKKRDDHLKSGDFFDEEKYPVITFESTKSKRSGLNTCNVSGKLTIHGISKNLDIEVEVCGPVKSPFGETSIGLACGTILNREDFGMMWNEPMEDGGLMVDRDVEVSMDIEADLTE
jgi:polyisoprenoid-binding protein YceI